MRRRNCSSSGLDRTRAPQRRTRGPAGGVAGPRELRVWPATGRRAQAQPTKHLFRRRPPGGAHDPGRGRGRRPEVRRRARPGRAGGPRTSYRQLLHQATTVTRALITEGVAPGDRAAIWSPNTHHWVLADRFPGADRFAGLRNAAKLMLPKRRAPVLPQNITQPNDSQPTACSPGSCVSWSAYPCRIPRNPRPPPARRTGLSARRNCWTGQAHPARRGGERPTCSHALTRAAGRDDPDARDDRHHLGTRRPPLFQARARRRAVVRPARPAPLPAGRPEVDFHLHQAAGHRHADQGHPALRPACIRRARLDAGQLWAPKRLAGAR